MTDDRLVIRGSLSIALSELQFQTSRSGGPGGQNVNKLETRVELLFDVERSLCLSEPQKLTLRENLKSKIDSEGFIHVVSQESRSQWQNKQIAIRKFTRLLQAALTPKKKRIKTKPTVSASERRLTGKKHKGQRKKTRKVNYADEE